MGKEILMFGNIEIKEDKFYCHKIPIAIKIFSKIFLEKKTINFYWLLV